MANNQTFEQCLLANISQCEFTENHKQFVVTVYNPLSRPVSHYVRLPVIDQNYQVIDPNGEKVFHIIHIIIFHKRNGYELYF